MTAKQIKEMGEAAIDPKRLWLPAWIIAGMFTIGAPAVWRIAMCASADREWKARTEKEMAEIKTELKSSQRWYPSDQQTYNGLLRERNPGLNVPTVREVVDRRIEP